MANYKDIKYDFSGENLTALNATQLTSGTTPDARYTTLPAVSGANLTALNATNLGSGTVPTARLGSGTASSSTFLTGAQTYAAAGGGKIAQVVSTHTVATSSFSSANTDTYVDLSGVTVDITPAATDSKILVLMNIYVQYSTGMCHVRLMRDTTEIGSATPASSQIGTIMGFRINDSDPYGLSVWPASMTFVDSPSSTSALTYKLQGTLGSSYNGTFYVNRSANDTDANYGWRVPSNITVMEILA